MTLGAMITISANDFLLVYLGLEIQALSSYVLTCLANTPISAESGLKYVLVGSFSSMLILFGISLVVYSLGTHNFNQVFLNLYCFNIEYIPNLYNILLTFGILSLLLGFLIKLGVAPFHLWLPDIYEGTLLPIALYFATTQKLINFIVFTRIFINIFENLFYLIQPIIAICSFICLVIGTLACISEMKLKRFLAFSSITHMGFLLLALTPGGFYAIQVSLAYFLVYYVLTFGAWYSLGLVKIIDFDGVKYTERTLNSIEDFGFVIKQKPLLGLMIGINFLSMGGIPPLVGFASKALVLNAVVGNFVALDNPFLFKMHLVFFIILVVASCSNVISSFYYIRLLKEAYSNKPLNFMLKNDSFTGNVIFASIFFFNIFGIFVFQKINQISYILAFTSI